MNEWTDPRHTAKGKTAKYVGLETVAPSSTPDSRKRSHARKVAELVRAAREVATDYPESEAFDKKWTALRTALRALEGE